MGDGLGMTGNFEMASNEPHGPTPTFLFRGKGDDDMRPADLTRLVLLAAVWGGSFLFVRMAVGAIGPLWLTELRVGLAAVAADVTGRMTGAPGLCIATLGPGAINLTTGVGSAGALLRAARRPVAVIGASAMRMQDAALLRAFVERHQMPFASTMMAKGLIDEDHPLSLGCIERAMRQLQRTLIQSADLVIGLGYATLRRRSPQGIAGSRM